MSVYAEVRVREEEIGALVAVATPFPAKIIHGALLKLFQSESREDLSDFLVSLHGLVHVGDDLLQLVLPADAVVEGLRCASGSRANQAGERSRHVEFPGIWSGRLTQKGRTQP